MDCLRSNFVFRIRQIQSRIIIRFTSIDVFILSSSASINFNTDTDSYLFDNNKKEKYPENTLFDRTSFLSHTESNKFFLQINTTKHQVTTLLRFGMKLAG